MYSQKLISDFFNKSEKQNKSNSDISKYTKNNNIKTFFKNEINNDSTIKTITLKPQNNENSKITQKDNLNSNEKKLNTNTQFSIFNENDKIIEKIDVFTDGSTINNGKRNASGGFGVYFPDDKYENWSEKFNSNTVTNQKCELMAIIKALQILKNKFGRHAKKVNVFVYTDSEYSINCMTKFIISWLKNNWKLRNGNNVKNRNLIELLNNLMNEFHNIKYIHVRSHTKEPENKDSIEYYTWYGNMMADKLANDGRNNNIFKS